MGYPSVTFSSGTYYMAFAQNPDIYLANSTSASQFDLPATPIVVATGSNEEFTPSLVCPNAGTHNVYVGRREFSPYPIIADQTVNRFGSTDLSSWSFSVGPYFSTADGDDEIRHLEMVTNSTFSRYGMFYTTPGTSGNDLYFAKTSGFDWKNIASKRCP